MEKEEIKKIVRENYAKFATKNTSCCSASQSCCSQKSVGREVSSNIGYSAEEMDKVPEGSNLGLGCGNPIALASLKEGEIVLDLGSGAGFDCFLAAEKVGAKGTVIGIDMTPEMIEKAGENAKKGNYKNVEFRLGEIENLPVADETIDIIISNCVINLSPEKERVFREAFRVLKQGGSLLVSAIVLTRPLPDYIKNDMAAYSSCISGAVMKNDYLNKIKNAGFINIEVLDEINYPIKYIISDGTAKIVKESLKISEKEFENLENSVLSIKVSAFKK